MRTVSLLGSTGLVGTQALDVLAPEPERFRVHALAAQRSAECSSPRPRLQPGARRHRRSRSLRARCATASRPAPRSWSGEEGMVAAATSADVVLNAVVGFAGLPVTMAALEAGKRLALANKESLIAGAPVVQKARRTPGAEIVPVDSEHCAVHQCLAAVHATHRRGPPAAHRLGRSLPGLDGGAARAVTVADALAHPTWSMGPKITIDSSTLMNKGLEVIEAHELFGIGYDRIDIVVHPQSIVHSMVELRDGSTLAQLSTPTCACPSATPWAGPTACHAVRRARLVRRPDPDLRAARPRRVRLHRPGLRGRPARGLGPGLAQRGQRGGRRGLPGRAPAAGAASPTWWPRPWRRGSTTGGRGRGRAGGRRRGPGPGPRWRWPDAWPGWRPVALGLP